MVGRKRKKPLSVDISKHILVPKHTKLNKKEAEKFLANYDVTIKNLLKIKIGDPAIVPLKPEIGDVIKIERPSPTAKESVFYRVVVSE